MYLLFAFSLYGYSTGGKDTLISGLGTDTMFGDALYLESTATGGNDILNAAMGGINGGEDVLYGDASDTLEDGTPYTQGTGGADLFIVGGNINAQIMDYNAEEGDQIVGALQRMDTSTINEQEQIQVQLNEILLQGNGKQQQQQSPTVTPISTTTTATTTTE